MLDISTQKGQDSASSRDNKVNEGNHLEKEVIAERLFFP